jgi:Glycosyl transferase family 2
MTPSMTIVCVAYKRPREVNVLIHSLLCQTSQDWDLHMIHDGPDPEMEHIFETYQELIGEDRFRYTMTGERYNDFGHSLRAIGIDEAKGKYILITNDDNYYMPIAVDTMLYRLNEGFDGVIFDMIHNYFNYTLFVTEPRKMRADIGSVATHTRHARTVGWRDKTHAGDGTYIDDLTKIPDFQWMKVPQVLFVHN